MSLLEQKCTKIKCPRWSISKIYLNFYEKIAKDKSKQEKIRRVVFMLKKLAWNTFKNTGDINTYMEFSKVIDLEKQLELEQNAYGNIQNERDNNCGEFCK